MMLDHVLTVAYDTARDAGMHALNHFGMSRSRLKTQDQIVTNADLECQEMIIRRIKEDFPDHGIVGEEGPDGRLLLEKPGGNEDIWWVIDPIDGTRNYAHGVSLFACSVGVLKDGIPWAGAIYDPCLDKMYLGAIDRQATVNGQPVQVLNETLHSNSQIAFSGNLHRKLPHSLGTFMANHVYVNLGSAALHYALVATGAFAAALSWNVKLWDIVAGAAIVQAAGGVVLHPDGSKIFPFKCERYQGEPVPVLFAHARVFEQIKAIIEPDLNLENEPGKS